MTIIKEARCNGPECTATYTLNDLLERSIVGLPIESSWFTFVFGSVTWHFCSYSCIAKWAVNKRVEQDMQLEKRKAKERERVGLAGHVQVGTSEHHGTKINGTPQNRGTSA